MKTDVYVLELWNRGVSEWLLFNVKRSNSSAISWRDRLQGDSKTSVTIEVLFVCPGVSDVFLLQYTVSDLYQRPTKNSNFIRDKIVYR
jgi:hypothetical protein